VTETFFLPRRELARITSATERAFPREACGLVACARSRSTRTIHVISIENTSMYPYAFHMDVVALSRARRAAYRRSLVPLGYFHSHPSGAPDPSWLDRRSMDRSRSWWLIYSRPLRTLRMVRGDRRGIERACVLIR
jgi:proteasome lid subunit RPN8/RPN11